MGSQDGKTYVQMVAERLEMVRELIAGRPSFTGECDEVDCGDRLALWCDPDSEGDGDYAYCQRCWNRRIVLMSSRLEREKYAW